MKTLILKVSLISFALLTLLTTSGAGAPRKDGQWLIFEGTVVIVGKAPPVICGVLSPYRLAKYHVDRVYEGSYSNSEIVVDHLFCKIKGLEDIKIGDKVFVVINLRQRPTEIWDDEEVRHKDDNIQKFYVAKNVFRITSDGLF